MRKCCTGRFIPCRAMCATPGYIFKIKQTTQHCFSVAYTVAMKSKLELMNGDNEMHVKKLLVELLHALLSVGTNTGKKEIPNLRLNTYFFGRCV